MQALTGIDVNGLQIVDGSLRGLSAMNPTHLAKLLREIAGKETQIIVNADEGEFRIITAPYGNDKVFPLRVAKCIDEKTEEFQDVKVEVLREHIHAKEKEFKTKVDGVFFEENFEDKMWLWTAELEHEFQAYLPFNEKARGPQLDTSGGEDLLESLAFEMDVIKNDILTEEMKLELDNPRKVDKAKSLKEVRKLHL